MSNLSIPTKCQCENPGYCQLLRRVEDPPEGRKMSEVRHKECRERPGWFEMFLGESIAGGNLRPRGRAFRRHQGLGDTVAWFLKKLGFRQKKTCGCEKRQKKLNAIFPYNTFWFLIDWIRFKLRK